MRLISELNENELTYGRIIAEIKQVEFNDFEFWR